MKKIYEAPALSLVQMNSDVILASFEPMENGGPSKVSGWSAIKIGNNYQL